MNKNLQQGIVTSSHNEKGNYCDFSTFIKYTKMFILPNLFIFPKIVTQWPWNGGYLNMYEDGLWLG